MTTSMTTSFHTMKTMKENAFKRDPNTGYCYKNGGRAPYGYKNKRILVGKDSRGKEKYKLLWEVDEEQAKILRKIIVDWRIGEGLSYDSIRDRLNELNIPGPKGDPWGTSTLVEMLRENRLIQYTGVYFWNKEDHHTPGKRFKDREDWIEVPNAHPPIITLEEAKAALAVTKSRQPRTAAARSFNSSWYLTGLNLEQKPFFTCKLCGKNIIGIRISNGAMGKYGCGTHHYKGNACTNNLKITRNVLERQLISMIGELFGTPKAIDSMVQKLNSKIDGEAIIYQNTLTSLEKQISVISKGIDATFLAFEKGFDPELCQERLQKQKQKQSELEKKLKEAQANLPIPLSIDPDKARDYFLNLRALFKSGTNEQKRTLFKTYIRQMVMDPENNQIHVIFYPPYLEQKIKHGKDFPCYISDGARGRT